MELRRSAGKAYQAGVLGADLSARSLYARLMAVSDRASGGRVADGGDPYQWLYEAPTNTNPAQ
jgi:hypothetical protein